MACDGTRVFVLGGILPPGIQANETKLIHVLDTSLYFLFVISLGQPLSLKTQNSLFTWNPTPTLSILVRRPLNSRGSRQRVTRSEDNDISRHLRQMSLRHWGMCVSSSLSDSCRKRLFRRLSGTGILDSLLTS